ncbi:MAG: hypothetical protein JF628_12305 [Sphingomonas sp.]|nr:hypothetical protein [Sphingomonas sp.]
MQPTIPLPLHYSWPLSESGWRFDFGMPFDAAALDENGFSSLHDDRLAAQGIGKWTCDLADNSLAWTDPVFDLFGLPRGARLSRDEIVALYCDESRAAMERLRAHAIKHRRGFTVDMEIRTVAGRRRWMRLLAAPVCVGDRVVRLHGLKQDISREYL